MMACSKYRDSAVFYQIITILPMPFFQLLLLLLTSASPVGALVNSNYFGTEYEKSPSPAALTCSWLTKEPPQ